MRSSLIQNQDTRGYRALADLYHAYLTGLIVALLVRRDETEVGELIFRLFRAKHLEQFLPGLEKLGLRRDGRNLVPDAVACAQYHYLSNFLGGVGVEYMPESDRKAWVRYPPPRWIWQGVAIAAIPSSVSAAMLRGWHGHNGVTLGNPRLGFVCTKQTVDGQPGLEGYYYEYDHDLEESERLRFAPGEQAPRFDAARAPVVPSSSWPEERLEKANRNYALDYVTTILPLLFDLAGEEALPIARHTARVIGLQGCESMLETLEVDRVAPFPEVLRRLIEAHGDTIELRCSQAGTELHQKSWRVFREVDDDACLEACFSCWTDLFVGLALAHDRFQQLVVRWEDFAQGPKSRSFLWRYGRGSSR